MSNRFLHLYKFPRKGGSKRTNYKNPKTEKLHKKLNFIFIKNILKSGKMILKDIIFRAYDIRGEAFTDFDEDGFFLIGQSFGQYIKTKFGLEKPRIFVSGDGRQSMPELWTAFVSGLEASGSEVIWGGILPTPINYFVFYTENFDASAQISASHNPPEDNGLKLLDKNGAICGEEIQKIKNLAFCSDCKIIPKNLGKCENNCEKTDFSQKYKTKILEDFSAKNPRNLKIVLDAGNGVSGLFYPEVFKKVGYKIETIYCDLDTKFPNHQPDPERPENLSCLQKKVLESKADFGLAFDGDGDRVGVVLNDGEIVNADKILFILASDFLSRNPNSKIVLDLMCSDILAEKITKKGGEIIWSKTGHSFIEEKMKEVSAKLGGEQSGHFMLGENWFGCDDACLSGLRFLKSLQNNENLIKEITDDWQKMSEFSEKIPVDEGGKFEIIDNFSRKILQKYPKANTLDGVRISFGKNEWAIVRCSNTSPKIAVRIEAENSRNLEKYKDELFGILEEIIKKN